MNQFLYRNLPYDPFTDFVPITLVAKTMMFIFVNAASELRSVDDLVAGAKMQLPRPEHAPIARAAGVRQTILPTLRFWVGSGRSRCVGASLKPAPTNQPSIIPDARLLHDRGPALRFLADERGKLRRRHSDRKQPGGIGLPRRCRCSPTRRNDFRRRPLAPPPGADARRPCAPECPSIRRQRMAR